MTGFAVSPPTNKWREERQSNRSYFLLFIIIPYILDLDQGLSKSLTVGTRTFETYLEGDWKSDLNIIDMYTVCANNSRTAHNLLIIKQDLTYLQWLLSWGYYLDFIILGLLSDIVTMK